MEISKRAISNIPSSFRRKPKTSEEVQKIIKEIDISDASDIEAGSLIWQKKNLPSSDAQKVSGNTKITGVLRLGDANFKIDRLKINRNTYFRDEVFGNLRWASELRNNNPSLEIAKCKFKVSTNVKNLGVLDLKISHDPDRISDQHNIPTTIHWGSVMISYLKKNSVIGKTLNLYFPKKGLVFGIVIE